MVALAQALVEVEEEYGEVGDDLSQALIETIVTSPHFHWLTVNIWHQIDQSMKN